jgi:hypothetical protein
MGGFKSADPTLRERELGDVENVERIGGEAAVFRQIAGRTGIRPAGIYLQERNCQSRSTVNAVEAAGR